MFNCIEFKSEFFYLNQYFLFLTGWLIFVYFPFVHMTWSADGILAQWGVLDFAGGIDVSPGSAALIGIVASLVCFSAVALKNKRGWDDALDVWGVHGGKRT